MNPVMPVKRTTGWSLWQYTDRGKGTTYGAGRATVCDLDVWNGTVSEMRDRLGINYQDVITNYKGMKRVSGMRNGWDFELFTIDPASVNIESVYLPQLDTVSNVAKRKGATLAINGGEWDRISNVSPA